LAHIYYLINEENEYEAQDEGDYDDVRDRIILVRFAPLPLLLIAFLAGGQVGGSWHIFIT
jgi:hypothetical protein